MARRIDTQAVNESVRFEEQAGDPAASDAGYWNLYAKATGLYYIDDAGNVTGPLAAASLAANTVPGGRLTLTTGVPVTTADVSAAATLYYTPYFNNAISLYNGSAWAAVAFTEKSLDIAAFTASKPYDIWGYLNSGTLALEGLVWTDATTRATALAYDSGRLIKSGDATRLYLGTIYINSSGGQTDDSVLKRNVYNYYNRVLRTTYKSDTTSHSYTTGTWRSWNNNATIRVEVTIGVVESPVILSMTAANESCYTSIGYDSTSTNVNDKIKDNSAGVTIVKTSGATYAHYPSAGFHFYQAVEYGASGATESDIYISADVMA